MTKEQEIYRNMKAIAKRRHTMGKSHGRWWVSYPTLHDAIKDAGFADDKTIAAIIDRMEEKGYIHAARTANGHKNPGTYIIDKWAN